MVKVLNIRPISKGTNLTAYATVQYHDVTMYFVSILEGSDRFWVALPNRKFNGRHQELVEFRDKKMWKEFSEIVLNAYFEFCKKNLFEETINILKANPEQSLF